jgi:hypothetical protein
MHSEKDIKARAWLLHTFAFFVSSIWSRVGIYYGMRDLVLAGLGLFVIWDGMEWDINEGMMD